MKNKVYESFSEAVTDISDGASVMMMSLIGPGGIPQNLIKALRDKGSKNLTVYACPNVGLSGGLALLTDMKPYVTPALLLDGGQVSRAIVTWTGGEGNTPSPLELPRDRGDIEVEIVPVGVYAQRMLAAGHGMAGFYSPVGVGTVYERGKEKRKFGDREYIFEAPMCAQYGFVRALKADKLGNLVYKGTMRCFNPLIAKAAEVTIAEVDEIVEPGELDPEVIVTPGVFVDRIVQIREGDLR